MQTQLYCPDEIRRSLVRANGTVNGIDYLEVLDDEAPVGTAPQQTLLVYCFLSVAGLSRENVRIEGGVRVSPIGVVWAFPVNELLTVHIDRLSVEEQTFFSSPRFSEPERVLVVRTDTRGDFSTYTLRLISATQANQPISNFDYILSSVKFSFKVDCPSDFDCQQQQVCPEPIESVPQIDYLAKDYASFRRLMLDRLAVLMPDWQERNPADLGITLVELLAYAADYLSYHQDAVATEAYLGTARQRVSVRRHARLVDYFLHDGANARTWVCLEVNQDLQSTADNPLIPIGTTFFSKGNTKAIALSPFEVARAFDTPPIVFESLHPVTLLNVKRNAILFYTWGNPQCCLPKGATKATLQGSAAELQLKAGDVLILEQVRGPESKLTADADPNQRHAVRLNSPPVEVIDPLNNTTVLEISWYAEDALPFPLCLWQEEDNEPVSVARGNVVLADHGKTLKNEALQPATVPEGRPYRPQLDRLGLTHAQPYDHEKATKRPAKAVMELDLRQVKPAIKLQGNGETWQPQQTLLNSDRFASEFVVEMATDGQASLRFGDGILGQQPTPGSELQATYRLGNGKAGNIGAEALFHIVTDQPDVEKAIQQVRNPLPAWGGTEPEPMEQARLYAPQAFRIQQRAVTEADYATVTERHPQVQQAKATRRWTGSWYTMFITVDRKNGLPIDADFEVELRSFLERFRLAGYDLEIDAPINVPLEIVLKVCVLPNYISSNVKRSLLEVFSNTTLPNGQRGFFHPDNFTFAQPVYLSQIVATAMQVPGVEWVQPLVFQRWRQLSNQELQTKVMQFESLEIARLDNDPNAPENGKIDFLMLGGL